MRRIFITDVFLLVRSIALCFLFMTLFVLGLTSNGGILGNSKVAEATGATPTSHLNIRDAGKFLNDLKLSPCWKVERDRAGGYVAVARSVTPKDDFDPNGREFLFERLREENPTLSDISTTSNSESSAARPHSKVRWRCSMIRENSCSKQMHRSEDGNGESGVQQGKTWGHI
jgi:hypothetical protein